MYFVYIIQCVDKTLYTGITTDLDRRIKEHNNSKLGAKYTKIRRPVKLVFSKQFENRSEASKEESRIKKLTRQQKINLFTKNKIMKKQPGEFSKKVVKLALTIPPGRVSTYGLITAAAGGHPMMSRSITRILGNSDQVDEIPFHRIVYSNGKIWDDPKYNKWRAKLYKKEGIKVDKNNKIIDFEKIIFSF